MTAWTTISNALVAVGAKPFATTIQAMRDNLLAAFEGATGAPRLHYSAMDRLRAGDEIRWSRATLAAVTSSTFTLVTGSSWGFIQAGNIRIRFNHWRTASTSEVRVRRTRAGTTSTLTTLSSVSGSAPGTAQSYDCDVQPGDLVFLEHRNTSGATSNVQDVTLGVLNATDILIPADDAMFGQVINPSIPSP